MCNECSYSSDKLDNLVKHVALGHSKLDELLLNEQLVNEKREQALNKPKKIHIGPQCPICDMKLWILGKTHNSYCIRSIPFNLKKKTHFSTDSLLYGTAHE